MKKILVVPIILLIYVCSTAQNFQNGDLEGTVNGFSSLPDDWEAINYLYKACEASGNTYASPDLTDRNGPYKASGNFGIPQSGSTFVSGYYGEINNALGDFRYHEGIKQSVFGFNPGHPYRVRFFQSVVRSYNGPIFNFLDKTGSWMVYLDDELIGISNPTTSQHHYDEPELNWEERLISFRPTLATHTFRFLPMDDDTLITASLNNGGILMGIDNIQIQHSSHVNSIDHFNKLTIYPNPSDGHFILDLKEFKGDFAISITNSLNQTYCQYSSLKHGKIPLKISGPDGIYFVRIMDTKGNSKTLKVLKAE